MRYWWVNHKQTWKEEFHGGYIWSPKRTKTNHQSQFYENMKCVQPGDVLISYSNAKIQGIGIAASAVIDAIKPADFESFVWDKSGWKVFVDFQKIEPLPIKEFHNVNKNLFPSKYSPLDKYGDGCQGCYLAEISGILFDEIRKLITSPLNLLDIRDDDNELFSDEIWEWETAIIDQIKDSDIDETEKGYLIKARIGQGKFRKNIMQLENMCRVTKVDDEKLLIASHIKPWRHSDNQERLSKENGLLLTPTIDKMFDRGFITFEDDGYLEISDKVKVETKDKLHIQVMNVGDFTVGQKDFLSFHRKEIFIG